MEQVLRGIEDIKRGYDVGIRGFLIYDEGMLWVVNEMRKDGALPKEIHFKCSAHLGHCNPASFKVLENLGADTINPVRDLQIPMIAALRAAVKVPIDVHTDNPPGSGGFIRVYEAPEIVRVAAPVYIKLGLRNAPNIYPSGLHLENTCFFLSTLNGGHPSKKTFSLSKSTIISNFLMKSEEV
jgi:hypothetical protein